MPKNITVFFNQEQLQHQPVFEWAFGEKIPHPETTHRAENIASELKKLDFVDWKQPEGIPLKLLRTVHNSKLITALEAASGLNQSETFYPSVFPYYRDKSNLDPRNIKHIGAFCFDSGTPITNMTFTAAFWSVSDAVSAAKFVMNQSGRVAYALCRPPGHHASKDLFGGYCYFNNSAFAAKTLQEKYKKVAILDIDFHHGNGTQVIFERDSSVLTISIHGNPESHYPYLSGYPSEVGKAVGKGFNLNLPLESGVELNDYLIPLDHAIQSITEFGAEALVVAAGFDTYLGDPIGSFCLTTNDFYELSTRIARLNLPTVICQEGGYDTNMLGKNVATFLTGFADFKSSKFAI